MVTVNPICAADMGGMKEHLPKRGRDYDHFLWGAASATALLVCNFLQKGYNIPRQDAKDALEAISKEPGIKKQNKSKILNAIRNNKDLSECHQIFDELGIQ